jgi:hypothetical protein
MEGKMKKAFLILTFWFLSVSVYSLDDSVYEVTSVRHSGNITDAQWNRIDWNEYARNIEAGMVKNYPLPIEARISLIGKVSNTITRKMLASLNDYNLEYGDVIVIVLCPHGNENSTESYMIVYHHRGANYQAKYLKTLMWIK